MQRESLNEGDLLLKRREDEKQGTSTPDRRNVSQNDTEHGKEVLKNKEE